MEIIKRMSVCFSLCLSRTLKNKLHKAVLTYTLIKFSKILRGVYKKFYVGCNFRPRSKGEYLFVIGQLLFGLLLFATVLGHVANIVTSVSASRKEFQGKFT